MTRGLDIDTPAYRQRVQPCMETEDDGMIACRTMLVVEVFLIWECNRRLSRHSRLATPTSLISYLVVVDSHLRK